MDKDTFEALKTVVREARRSAYHLVDGKMQEKAFATIAKVESWMEETDPDLDYDEKDPLRAI